MSHTDDIPFASDAAEAAYQQALKDGIRITRDQVRRMLQAFDIEYGVHSLDNAYSSGVPDNRTLNECPGHGSDRTGEKCCERAGVYNGFGSDGPLDFVCPRSCSCHD
jgi:hypothetical protein